jgi:hypothetical protein
MSVLELAVFIVFFGWVRGVALCPSLPIYPNFSIPFSPRTSYNLDLSICTTTISAD